MPCCTAIPAVAMAAFWVGVFCVLGAAAIVIAVWSAAVPAGRQFGPAPQIRRLANVRAGTAVGARQPAAAVRLAASRPEPAVVQAPLGIWVLIGCVQVGWQARTRRRPRYAAESGRPAMHRRADGGPLPPLTADGHVGINWFGSRISVSATSGSQSAISPARDPDSCSAPRPPRRRPEQAGGQQQPGARIGLHHVGRIAAGVPGPRNALHSNERRHPHLDAGARRLAASVRAVSRTASASSARAGRGCRRRAASRRARTRRRGSSSDPQYGGRPYLRCLKVSVDRHQPPYKTGRSGVAGHRRRRGGLDLAAVPRRLR